MAPRSGFTQDVADSICERLAEGESLRAVCRELGLVESTIRAWALDDVQGFSAQYTRARQLGAQARADSIQEDYDMPPEKDQYGKVDPGWVAMQRLKIDSKKWEASKMLPKQYGDKLELSGNAEAPLAVRHTLDTSALTDEQLRALAGIKLGGV